MAARVSEFSIIAFTETWLSESFSSSELFSGDYSVFRCDRDYERLNCQRGGGTLIAVESGIAAKQLKGSVNYHYEDLWVSLRFKNDTVILGTVYFPPNSHIELYQDFVDTLELHKSLNDGARFLICGDFNLSHIKWEEDDGHLVPTGVGSGPGEILFNNIYYLELQQTNSITNVNNRILDLVFHDNFDFVKVSNCKAALSAVDPHHPPLEIVFCTANAPLLDCMSDIQVHVFDRADYVQICDHLSGID